MRLGVDISTYFEELSLGAKYYADGAEVDPVDLFKKNGVDCMRIRLWVDPVSEDGKPYLGGGCDIENFFRLAEHFRESPSYRSHCRSLQNLKSYPTDNTTGVPESAP